MKYFETLLNGESPIVTLSYNNANGDLDLGNHIRIYTGYETDNYDDDFPGFLVSIDDYHFKSFDIIRQLFPDVKQLVIACPAFYRDNMSYIKKETDCEGYKLFHCADGDYSENVREDDFIYLFRTNINPLNYSLSRCMDYTLFVDIMDEGDTSDRYDNSGNLLFTKVEKYRTLSIAERDKRKKENNGYRLNHETLPLFDAYYKQKIDSDYYIGYISEEDTIWCEIDDGEESFQDAAFKVRYDEPFYLFKLNKVWTTHGTETPYYFFKLTKDREEALSLFNKPLTYFIGYISADADGEQFTDAYHGMDNINKEVWKCEYYLKELRVSDGSIFSTTPFNGNIKTRTMTINEAE